MTNARDYKSFIDSEYEDPEYAKHDGIASCCLAVLAIVVVVAVLFLL